MAQRNFPGKSKAWLEQKLSTVCDTIAAGGQVIEWKAGDLAGSRQANAELPPERVRDLLIADLAIVDPVNYTAADAIPISRTVVRFM